MKKLFITLYLLLSFGSLIAQKEKPVMHKKTTNLSLEKLLQKTIEVANYDKNYTIVSYNGKPTYTLDSLNKNLIRIKLKVEKQYLTLVRHVYSLHNTILKIQLTQKAKDKNIPPPPLYPFEDTLIDAVWEILLEKQEDANHSSIQIIYSNITKESLTKVKNIVKKESPSDGSSYIIVDPNKITSKLVFEKELAEDILGYKEQMINIPD